MIFRAPIPFQEAIESRTVRQILPTEFRTSLLQEIPAQLRERAFFSAGVQNATFLERASQSVDDLLSGTVDRATKRLELKRLLGELGYRPPEGEEGTLTDLSGDRRLNLILDQNLQTAQGYGRWKQGQDPAILDQWPAQELVDTNPGKTENRRDWTQRWADAGGRFFGGRMIALKNDPIWKAISRFGMPYPPFDFGSYWDVADVSRDEAVAFGLIDRDTELLPQDRDFNQDLQASPEIRSESLRTAILDHFDGRATFVDGILKLVGGGV